MPEEILTEITTTETPLSYKIDGVDFKSFGVYVSKSRGIAGALKLKESQTYNWLGDHGNFIDLSNPRYEQREIVLDCFIITSSKLDFINKSKAFINAFQKPNLRVFDLFVADKPIRYMCYCPDGFDIEKTWNNSKMIGTFSIKLIEPQPIKRLLKFTATTGAMTALITLTTNNPINIYWGDGSKLLDVYGDVITKTRVYTTIGTYYILIAGVIEEISSFSTNAEVVWSKY